MTATNLYFSTNSPNQDRPYSAVNSGASGSLNQGFVVGTTEPTAADYLSLRIMAFSTTTTVTGISKRDILNFLDLCKRWVVDNTAAVNAAAGTDVLGAGAGQGLDYVIANTTNGTKITIA